MSPPMALGDQAVQGAGRILAGRYRLVSVVGRGGMGTVWRAVDEVLHRDVAIKEVLLPDSAGDAERESRHERTLREARATARLNHPGVVTVHDVVDEDGRPWIVMELVQARSLQEIIDDDGSLPPERVAEIGRQVVAALSAAHAIGIMHRDVKPANVLLAADGRAVLTDFGIAHIAGDATLTSTGGLLGSPAYMSPQRINGERATPAADMWGLGATLYAAVEGRPPFDRSDAMAVLAAVMTQRPKEPRQAGPLAPVLAGLLTKDPVERMTAADAEQALASVARGQTVPAPRTASPPVVSPSPAGMPIASVPVPVPVPTPDLTEVSMSGPPTYPAGSGGGGRARKFLIPLAAAVLVAAAAVGGFVLLNNKKGDDKPGPQPSTPIADGKTGKSPGTSVSPKAGKSGTGRAPLSPGLTSRTMSDASFGVPSGWTNTITIKKATFWRDGAGAYVQFDTTPWTGKPMVHAESWIAAVRSNNELPGFQKLRLEPVQVGGAQAAELEYKWTNKSGPQMHAISRSVIVDGTAYAFVVAVPEARWSGSATTVKNVLDSFRP